MTASKLWFSLLGSSILRNHPCKTFNFTSPARFTTTTTRLSTSPSSLFFIRQCSSSSAALLDPSIPTSDFTRPSYSSSSAEVSHPWPEWVSFVDRLKAKGYFNKSLDSNTPGPTPSAAAGLDNDEARDDGLVIYTDASVLKDACLSFARDRFDLLKSLPEQDIQTMVEKGCPSLFRKTVNSAKRLRAHVRLDEGEVCSACILRGSCDRAYVILTDTEASARTVDILRILLHYALDPAVLSGGKMPPGREDIEASARRLLSELIELSDTVPDPDLPRPSSPKRAPKVQEKKGLLNHSDDENYRNVEMKRGDWMCPQCNFMNFARNLRCLKCKTEGPKRVEDTIEMKKGDWNCPGCGCMNFASKVNCFRCREPRPPRQLNVGEWECPSCMYLNYRRNMTCKKCDCKRPKDGYTESEGQIWRRPF